MASLFSLIAVGAPISPAGDIEGEGLPSFKQLYSLSKIVAVVRIEFGAVGSFSSQIFRGRVTEPFKGTEKNRAVYFWGGNVGAGDSYLIGETYLVMLHDGFRSVGDALTAGPDKEAALYKAAPLNGPIRFRRDDRINPSQSVFIFSGSAHNLEIAGRGWLGRKEMLEYLERLASDKPTKQ